jgi:putative restriction endonuclease
VRAYLGVTDTDWIGHLRVRPQLREVNFWRPMDRREFKVIEGGAPFLFKAKAPLNRIVGGGIFEAFVFLPISSAWEFFGEGNGVNSREELVKRISAISGESRESIGDREIGCVLLRDVSFFSKGDDLPTPPSFASNNVQGKSYGYPGEDSIVDSAIQRILVHAGDARDEPVGAENLGPTRGEPRLVVPRLGQSGFKAVVQETYHRRCAVTGHKILPTLQAAHILPVSHGGQHRIDNGLLLRSDVHTLFDRGYIGIDSEYRIRVSPRLRSEFGNGDELYARDGAQIEVPPETRSRPSADLLTWHLQKVFH